MTTTYLDAAREVANDLATELANDVIACEQVMARRLGSNVETVSRIGEHVSGAGGKRLRPALVALAAHSISEDFDRSRIAAIGACVEMIHMATLIHDDVIDHATTRRGRPTASALWGNTASILSGDVLLAKAMDILAEDGDLRIIRLVSRAVVEMAEGEVAEVEARGDFDLSRERHLEILRLKTATFIRCCCAAGALVAGANEAEEGALASFGEAVGMGFQIADDLLDFKSSSEESGKPRASDFREGQATLPIIYLRDRLNTEEDTFVRSRFGNGSTEDDLLRVLDLLDAREACTLARDDANVYAERARKALQPLAASPAKDLLTLLPTLLVERNA